MRRHGPATPVAAVTALQVLVGGAVTVIVAAGGWVVAVATRREQSKVEQASKSGTIRTSEASELWAEATKMREHLRDELEDRDIQIAKLGLDVNDCQKACQEARKQTEACERREKLLMDKLAAQDTQLVDALDRLGKAGL